MFKVFIQMLASLICQKKSSHLKFFTLPPVVAVVTIIRYGIYPGKYHIMSFYEPSGAIYYNGLYGLL